MWNFELQNGSQGKIIRLLDNPRVVVSDEGYETDAILGYVMWDDGVERALHESMLPYMDLGFAMSVHKSQGSQWDIVVIAITGNPILDRTLIYTAMTRACKQVIFVGDRKALEKAIKNPPKVEERLVGLFGLF